jgi:hypothetical protein
MMESLSGLKIKSLYASDGGKHGLLGCDKAIFMGLTVLNFILLRKLEIIKYEI